MVWKMDRARSPEACMAPVLARLVRSLAMLSLAAGIAIVIHSGVWAVLCFTEVRSHGLTAVTNPERVPAEEAAAPDAGGIVSVKSASAPAVPAAAPSSDAPPEAADSSAAPSGGDRVLSFLTSLSTIVGVASLFLLPIVLIVAFLTALVRAPRAANASMAGILWAILAFAMVVPWATFWPQVAWPGLFASYTSLVSETESLRAAGNPFTFVAFLSHVLLPGAVIAVLVGLAWRCGEPLHAELMAAESLQVDPEIERDASMAARKGPTVARSRSAASLAVATHVPAVSVDEAVESEPADDRPRRLI